MAMCWNLPGTERWAFHTAPIAAVAYPRAASTSASVGTSRGNVVGRLRLERFLGSPGTIPPPCRCGYSPVIREMTEGHVHDDEAWADVQWRAPSRRLSRKGVVRRS
jgi:hypothetical protein